MNWQRILSLGSIFIISFLSVSASDKDLTITTSESLQSDSKIKEIVRPEHISLNVHDPVSMVKWYCKNLEMIVTREGTSPNYNYFIADSGKHIMLEIANNADYVPINLPETNINSIHLAFMVKNITAIKEKLISQGATLAKDISTNNNGDKVMTLRDPWGLPIQFLERVKPILKYSDLRPDHLELNVVDTREKAKWYVDNLNFKIISHSDGPSYNMFISDTDENIMLELNQDSNSPMLEFDKIDYNSFHLAFSVEDMVSIKEKLIKAGAKLAEDIKRTAVGDQILMLRDPWGQPIQFVKRAKPMLK